MKKIFNFLSICICLSLTIGMFTACGNKDTAYNQQYNTNNRLSTSVNLPNDYTDDTNYNKNTKNITENKIKNIKDNVDVKTARIYNKLATLGDIQNPQVLINGSTALVSMNVSNLSKMSEETIKQKVIDTVKLTDANIKKVIVTTDDVLSSKIKQLAEYVKKGKPIDSFNNEINSIINKIEER